MPAESPDYQIVRSEPSPLLKGLSSGARSGAYYIKIEGETQGAFPGSSYAEGFKDFIEVIEWHYKCISPRDATSGMASGKRKHFALRCLGKADKSTPYLMTALWTNENLKTVQLDCYSQVKGGKAVTKFWNFYSVTLTNASLASVEHTCSPLDSTLLIEYMFTFTKINITEKEGNVESMDDWESAMRA